MSTFFGPNFATVLSRLPFTNGGAGQNHICYWVSPFWWASSFVTISGQYHCLVSSVLLLNSHCFVCNTRSPWKDLTSSDEFWQSLNAQHLPWNIWRFCVIINHESAESIREHLTGRKKTFSFGHCPKRGGNPSPNLLALFPPCNCPLYLDINIMLCVYFLVILTPKSLKVPKL